MEQFEDPFDDDTYSYLKDVWSNSEPPESVQEHEDDVHSSLNYSMFGEADNMTPNIMTHL